MKIGIITFHRAINYGAVLQCYALKSYFDLLGYDVEVIDYRNPEIEKQHTSFFRWISYIKQVLILRPKVAITFRNNHLNEVARIRNFERFTNTYLNLSSLRTKENVADGFDKIIIGSDQMWSIGCYKKFDPVYWGEFDHQNCLLYGYAISSNADFVKLLSLEHIRNITKSFKELSFRESKIQDLVNCITNSTYTVTLDPTLMVDADVWEKLIDKRWEDKKYVVIYQVRNPDPVKSKQIEEQTNQYAKKNGLEIIDLRNGSYSVEDFISAIKYAKCVFTSSFHATVFSLVFNVPFFSFLLHDGGDSRYENLLVQLGLQDHIVETDAKLSIPLYSDAKDINERIKALRFNSIKYLNAIVN